MARGATSRAVEDAVNWYNQGGVVTFCWHWNAPSHLVDTPVDTVGARYAYRGERHPGQRAGDGRLERALVQ